MKKRPLVVFAGQSNMMGACVYPPQKDVTVTDSWEYLHKPVRMGAKQGQFRMAGFPCGEFSYCELKTAYPNGMDPQSLSELQDYRANTYFVASMCNLRDESLRETEPFASYSEYSCVPGPSLPPYLAQEWERRGHVCAYAHIAKGAVSILHYFDDEMLAEYHAAVAQKYARLGRPLPEMRRIDEMCRGASAYFEQKTIDFFRDSEARFAKEDTSDRCLVWLQGEGDAQIETEEYQTLLEVLWNRARCMGFTRFFCLRVGYFGNEGILQVMKAQERFCEETPGAFMLSRACSLMPYAGQREDWFLQEPEEEYRLCRDSFFGYANQHINEKGFLLIAKHAAENMERILLMQKPPVLENENIAGMTAERNA